MGSVATVTKLKRFQRMDSLEQYYVVPIKTTTLDLKWLQMQFIYHCHFQTVFKNSLAVAVMISVGFSGVPPRAE